LIPSTAINGPLILCRSVHHGNTGQVADALTAVLDADVADPEPVTPAFLF